MTLTNVLTFIDIQRVGALSLLLLRVFTVKHAGRIAKGCLFAVLARYTAQTSKDTATSITDKHFTLTLLMTRGGQKTSIDCPLAGI
jgi:hypothetical protein